ncbi:hypothetical protein GE09DRAFT_569618 [Coniochaeta sp. 2T2.1]|nr:hypothetical protein GE09DRAFT_569618 [Coniochaeta sp. 2T2.1]
MAARLSSRMALVARSTSISTGAIVGATIGSVIGATIIFLCALPFILRARRLRAFKREHGEDAVIEDFHPGSPDFLSRAHFGDAFRRLSHSTPAQPPPKAVDGQESTDHNGEPTEKQQTTLYPTGVSVQYGLPSPISPAQPATARFEPLPGRALHDGRTATGSLTLATQTTHDSIPTQMLSQEPTMTEAGTSFRGHSISDSFASPSRKGTFGSRGFTDEPESLGKPGHKRRSSHLSDSVRHLAQRASAALRRDSTLSTGGGSLRSPPLAPNDDFPHVASAPAVIEPVDTEARGEAYSYYHGFDAEPAAPSGPMAAPQHTASYGPPISIPAPASAPPRSAFTSPTSASTVTPISPVSPVGPSPLTSRPTFGLGHDGADNVYAEPEDFRPPSLREKRNLDSPLKRMGTQPLKPIENDIPSPPLPTKSDDSVNPMDIWGPTTATEKDHQTKQELVKLTTPSPPTRFEATPPLEAFPTQPTPDATPEPDVIQEDDMVMHDEESEPDLKQEPKQEHSPYVSMPPPQIAIENSDVDMAGASGRYTPPASIPSYPTTPGYVSDPNLTAGQSMPTPSPRSNDGPSDQSDSSPRLYKCDECNRVFDQYHKLNHHTRYHDRPHLCEHPGCGKRFGTKTHLDRHINDKHTKTKKYFCTQYNCPYSRQGGKSFPRKDNWRRHMQNKHNIRDAAEPVVEFCEEAIMDGTQQEQQQQHMGNGYGMAQQQQQMTNGYIQAQAGVGFDPNIGLWTPRPA